MRRAGAYAPGLVPEAALQGSKELAGGARGYRKMPAHPPIPRGTPRRGGNRAGRRRPLAGQTAGRAARTATARAGEIRQGAVLARIPGESRCGLRAASTQEAGEDPSAPPRRDPSKG